jgi:hypothetical protein
MFHPLLQSPHGGYLYTSQGFFFDNNAPVTAPYSRHIPFCPGLVHHLEVSPAPEDTGLLVPPVYTLCRRSTYQAGPVGQGLSVRCAPVATFQRETCKCNHMGDCYLGPHPKTCVERLLRCLFTWTNSPNHLSTQRNVPLHSLRN